jgi:hypothetical protein
MEAAPAIEAPVERKKLSTTAIVILVILGVQLGPMLLVLPFMLLAFMAGGAFDGANPPDPLVVQLIVLSALAALLGAMVFAWTNQDGRHPGRPVGPRRMPYDLVGGGGLGDRLRRLAPGVQSTHRIVLWSLVVAVGLSALGILAAIVVGPKGPSAALFGLLLLGGWLLTLLAYVAGGYRFLLPTAAALLLFGLLLHVDAVLLAWGGHLPGSVNALALLALIWLALAPAIEALHRRPSPVWTVALLLATALTAAVPVVLIAGLDGATPMRIASALSGAGILLALSGSIRLLPVATPWRAASLAVVALWGISTLVAAMLASGMRERLLAAAVLVALVTLIATVTAFFVQRPRGTPA